MPAFGAIFMAIFGMAFNVVLAFIFWKFYEALARLGNELAEIKVLLRDRLNPPGV